MVTHNVQCSLLVNTKVLQPSDKNMLQFGASVALYPDGSGALVGAPESSGGKLKSHAI